MKIRLMLTILLICLLLGGCGKEASDESQIVLTTGFEEGELFYVGDKKCYIPEVKVYIRNLEDRYGEIYGDDIMEHKVGDVSVMEKLSSMALSRIAEVKALTILAGERELSLSDRDIEKCQTAADRYYDSLSAEDRRELEITPEMLLSMYEEYALSNMVYEDITKEVDPEISDDEARIITIQRIFIKNTDPDETRQKENEIYTKLSEGASFDSLADEYNEAEESTYSFGKETDAFSKEFVDICFDLSKEEVSSPVLTDDGVSIVKCVSTYDRERTDANKARMVERRKSDAFDSIYSSFARNLHTNFNTDLWNSRELSDRRLDSSENFFNLYDEIFSSPGLSQQ